MLAWHDSYHFICKSHIYLSGRFWEGLNLISVDFSPFKRKGKSLEKICVLLLSGVAVILLQGSRNWPISKELNWRVKSSLSTSNCVYCITLPCLWIPCFLTKIILLVISSSNQPTELSTKLLETDFKIDHFNRNISTLNCMLFKKRKQNRILLDLPNIFQQVFLLINMCQGHLGHCV